MQKICNFINVKLNNKHIAIAAFTGLLTIISLVLTFGYKIPNLIKKNVFNPYESESSLDDIYSSGSRYTKCCVPILYYTGYNYTLCSSVKGYYYYSLYNENCTIYIIPTSYIDGEEPPVTLSDVNFTGRIMKSDNLSSLIDYMSYDLDFSSENLANHTSTVFISGYHYQPAFFCIIIACDIIFGLATILFLTQYLKSTMEWD